MADAQEAVWIDNHILNRTFQYATTRLRDGSACLGRLASKSDVVVLVVGEIEDMSGESRSRCCLGLPQAPQFPFGWGLSYTRRAARNGGLRWWHSSPMGRRIIAIMPLPIGWSSRGAHWVQ